MGWDNLWPKIRHNHKKYHQHFQNTFKQTQQHIKTTFLVHILLPPKGTLTLTPGMGGGSHKSPKYTQQKNKRYIFRIYLYILYIYIFLHILYIYILVWFKVVFSPIVYIHPLEGLLRYYVLYLITLSRTFDIGFLTFNIGFLTDHEGFLTCTIGFLTFNIRLLGF